MCQGGFLASQTGKFISLRYGEIQYLVGPLGPLKVKESCQSMHFGKIPEMESISKPRLPSEIYSL